MVESDQQVSGDPFNAIGLRLDPCSFIVMGRRLIRSELNLIRAGNPFTISDSFRLHVSLDVGGTVLFAY